MENENTGVETPGQQNNEPNLADATWDENTPTVDKVRIERDRVRKELQAAQAKLKEFETEKARIEEEKARSEGNWKQLLETREKRLSEATKQLEQLQKAEEKRVQQDRENALLESVANKTGVQDRRLLRALMREAAQDGMFELAPESADDKYVELVKAQLDKNFPGLLRRQEPPSGVPGLNTRGLAHGEAPVPLTDKERVEKIAQSFGPKSSAAVRPWKQ